ncbi:DNA methyltransferase [Bradyrhizobium sp. CCGE-LA001]|uniref:DNA methyltransferase n=1 Tax=Bradyrhizobium sp. CCGE-LA001 TaxID=1223566 RepID=UPI0002AAAE60|nr:DNA methyltransferase [Bradyrhizobium sp. CCGE-LA001]AMA60095.1 hypothetical protein BCCGELA001_30240 [Bradyrhizobium sp. CCGE-LA001]
MTEVALTQFYGIELTDFATETAKLSLWIAEYQMNEMFKATFGKAPPALPLRESGNIVHGNAAFVDWTQVCPLTDDRETYIVGNPPYLGRADQTKEQKADMAKIFAPLGVSYKSLDYVACWYVKAAHYCKSSRAQCALVTTNSICQGEQVALLRPIIYKNELEIGFAHQPFKWRNSAAKNAAVTCVIVGIRSISEANKVLYSDAYHRRVTNISPYLVEGEDIFVTKRRAPISFEKDMTFGSMANDGGNLLLSASEKDEILARYPEATKFFKRLYGSQEFSKGTERWCLWIEDRDVDAAEEIPPIRSRIEAVRAARSDSDRESTAELAAVPHRFAEVRHKESDAIIVPKNTSERRFYITAGFIEAGSVISDLAFAVYDADPYIFSIISSRLHYVWGASVGGRFKMDPRYSNTLVYNTFPIPKLSDEQKASLEDLAVEVLGARETHPGKTISWLYDPDNMPSNRHGLLAEVATSMKEPASVDEILDMDDDLLSSPNDDIFTMRHARTKAARPDKVSERKPARDFDRFKPLFDECVGDLVSGKPKSLNFANEQEINAGEFFILNGVMVYVAEVNDPHFRNGKRNACLRLILENGTEGEDLLRSLATELYKDLSGRRISSAEAGPLFGSPSEVERVSAPASRITGCIYVVKSLSNASEIAELDGRLFKIGFTTGSFEDRVRDAKDDPTFRFAPVHPVRTYDAVDLNTGKFEYLLHRFFAETRLNIEIKDRFGKPFKPKEWFLLKLPTIEDAIAMLLDGKILNQVYDAKLCQIVRRSL